MRFVDLRLLTPPPGWEARARLALDELRSEIAAAETRANASGRDAAVARRSAISAGLAHQSRQQIWRELLIPLAQLNKGKCWYSESTNPTADKNVDHFRPKTRVLEDASHEGYWWLAFDQWNYRYCSQWCNQRRVDRVSGTAGGKREHFPLQPEGVRARTEGDDLDLELPELLDPADPEDWKLLTFRIDGLPVPAHSPGTTEHRRAATSIEVYHLHCRELVQERRILAGQVQRLVQDLERLRPNITDPKLRVVYKNHQVELLRAIHADSEYSAAARAYARGEIYKLDRGELVKREWLQEMLD